MSRLAYLETDKSEKKIAFLFLNRPEKMNAFSGQMISDIQECIDKATTLAANKEISCLIVRTNQPKAFCAGADLTERIKMSQAEVSQTLATQRKLMDSLASLKCVTIASVQGLAFGGGLELALACDLRIAGSNAQMGLTETKLAIIPGAGGTQRLSRLVGIGRAKEYIFRAKKILPDEALSVGLVNAVSENPDKLSFEWAQEICEAGPVALGAAKESLDGGQGLSLNSALDLERSCYEKVLVTEDRIEGLKAFSEKRKPLYKGI